jgi:hypothetical protein
MGSPDDQGTPPLAEALRELSRDSRDLVIAQIDLLRSQLDDRVALLQRRIAPVALGITFGLVGVWFLADGTSTLLADHLPAWLARLAVGGALLLVAGALFAAARRVPADLMASQHGHEVDLEVTSRSEPAEPDREPGERERRSDDEPSTQRHGQQPDGQQASGQRANGQRANSQQARR